MPFEVGDSVEGEALIPGLAEYIALQLQRAEVLAQASTGGPMGERPRDAGTRLGADAVLTGTLRPLPGGWQVSVELTRTSDGSKEWTWVFEVSNDTDRPTGAGPDDARSRIQGFIGGRIASGLAGRLADRID
jgi:TolB-like protein